MFRCSIAKQGDVMSVQRPCLSGAASAALGAGFLLALLCPQNARAEDLPSKGDFRITYTAVEASPTKPVSIGDNRTVGVNTFIMTAVNQAGSGLLHNMTGHCTSMTTADAGAKTFESHGYCDYVDAAGDHVFEKYDYPVQQVAATTHADGEWVGGTGKFAGLGGKFEIQGMRLPSPTDGAAQRIGQKVGSYTIETASASR